MLNDLNLLTYSDDPDFFELSDSYKSFWVKNFEIEKDVVEFHPNLDDYTDYWEKH